VELEVADDGPGVDPHVGDRLFVPGLSGPGGGTGLGLGIARRVARSLGGEVSLLGAAGLAEAGEAGAAARPGGATFVLRLPRL
jgi:two-component system, OmpR family, sensor kinase